MAIVEAGVSCCAGLNAGDVERLADEAVAATMRPRIYHAALSAIAERRARGELTLLATGSNGFVARALARAVGAHDGIGTEGRRVGERLTAEMILPACVGEGKKTLVLAWLAAHGVEPENATAYTDNGIDIPLLDAVGEAIAVNADAELAAYATRRGLRVERWVTPLDSNHRRSGESWPLKLEVDE
jgi:phosphoserine phosphatase